VRTGGESERFRSLYEKYFSVVVAFFRRQGIDPDTARDLAQDTFLRMYQAFDQYRGEAEWAYIRTLAQRILFNVYRDRNASKRTASILSIEDEPPGLESLSSGEDLHAAYVDRELAARLRSAVTNLPDGMRAVVGLFLNGESYEEIAKSLRISVPAVKSRLRDARRVLREHLAGDIRVDDYGETHGAE
jgi:RNA polymerase sigma-70 factor (ECF subfamily)